MTSSVGVRLQRLAIRDQALVLARTAGSLSPDGSFSPSELQGTFDTCGLPRPAKPANVVQALARDGLVAKRSKPGRWWMTPLGRERSTLILGDMDLQAATVEADTGPTASLGHVRQPLLPTSWAPPELVRPLLAFLREFPFESNVFLMTRFPTSGTAGAGLPDPVEEAVNGLRRVCSEHGLVLHLAWDHTIVPDLWENVLAHMWACKYGIALFENTAERGVNYNLTIEVGGMVMAGRPTALLKDESVPTLPSDFVGKIYKDIRLDSPDTVDDAIHRWLRDDLRLGACGECPSNRPKG